MAALMSNHFSWCTDFIGGLRQIFTLVNTIVAYICILHIFECVRDLKGFHCILKTE